MACCVKASILLVVLMCALVTEASYSKNTLDQLYKSLEYKCKSKEFMQCSGSKGRRGRWTCKCPLGYSCAYSPEEGAFLCLPVDPTSDYDSVANRAA